MKAETKARKVTRLLKTFSVSDAERNYVAGLLDGEGHVSMRSGRSAEVHVTSMERDLVAVPDQVFEVGIIRTYQTPKGETAYRWVVGGSEAAAVLAVLLPVMRSPKRKRAAKQIVESYLGKQSTENLWRTWPP